MVIIKKVILTVCLILATTLNLIAQNINIIPNSSEIKRLPDGWHKFTFEGTRFDVEIAEGYLVKGNIVWFDGSTYSGSLKGFKISGNGTYIWTDGKRYEGTFKNNLRHGKGSMIQPDNSKWSGKWKNDKKNGKGKLFDASGKIIQQGVWVGNKYSESKKK